MITPSPPLPPGGWLEVGPNQDGHVEVAVITKGAVHDAVDLFPG